MVFAVLVFVLLTETGARAPDGNFYWQVVVSSFIFHTVILSELLEARAAGEKLARVWICWSAYGLMVASGVFYVARFFRDDTFLPF